MIREQVSSGTEATEALAYLRGFMATFHLRPLDDIGAVFVSLVHLSEEWPRAGHAVQDETIAQLLAYRDDAGSRRTGPRLDAFVAPRRSELFWNRLPEGTAT